MSTALLSLGGTLRVEILDNGKSPMCRWYEVCLQKSNREGRGSVVDIYEAVASTFVFSGSASGLVWVHGDDVAELLCGSEFWLLIGSYSR